MPLKSDLLCKGHTLPLSGTLLADALSKEASGLCVSDCASYVQVHIAYVHLPCIVHGIRAYVCML